MRATAFVLVTILMIGLAGVPAFSQSPPHLQAKQALALVETSAGTGSGFAVGPNLVATACHVIKGATAIRVHFWAAKMQANGRQVMCNERYDIAYTEDAALATAEGVRLGSTDVDLVKTYGTPVCSSLFSYGGRAHLAWVYRGMFAFLTGAPRRIEAVAVFPAAAADAICR